MRIFLFSIVLSLALASCSKSEFDFPMDENLYESRYPLEINRLYGYMAPVGMANQHHIYVSWRMDKKYLQDFYPGYVISLYRKSGDQEFYIADIVEAEGYLRKRANIGPILFRATQGDYVIFEFVRELE